MVFRTTNINPGTRLASSPRDGVRGEAGFDITAFTQSLGPELITNGGFGADTNWTKGTGWTISGGAAHCDGSNGANSNLFQGAGLVSLDTYEIAQTASNVSAASVRVVPGGTTLGVSRTTNGTFTDLLQARTDANLYIQALPGFVGDIDNVSCKRVTLNALQTFGPNGTYQFQFALPASPIATEVVRVFYRMVDSANFWVAYVQRNAANSAWDFRLDSVVASTATNRINATGIGDATLIKAEISGNTHNLYTGTGTIDAPTYTQRGSTITNTTHNTATGTLPVYSSTFTPQRFKAA